MREIISFAICVVLTFAAFVGCSPDKGKSATAKSAEGKAKKEVKFDPGNFSTYRANDVLVQIGKRKLTKRDIDRMVDLRLKTLRFSLPVAQQDSSVNRMSVQVPLLVGAAGAFRAQTAILNWAETNNITVTESDLRKFETAFMRNCKQTGNNFELFLKKFTSSECKTIRERIKVEAISDKVRARFLHDNPKAVKQIDVPAFLTYLTNYNHIASATNAFIWAKATNLWIKAKNGADFAKLAAENTEDASHPEDGEWGTFRLSDLANDGQLDKVVASLKAGEVSAPVEADNGLNVIKLVSVVDQQGNPIDIASRTAESRYTLSRIFLQLPEIYEIPSVEDATTAMKLKAEDDAFLKFLNGLMAVDGVQYPNGELVFENARKMAKMPMMFQQEGTGDKKK